MLVIFVNNDDNDDKRQIHRKITSNFVFSWPRYPSLPVSIMSEKQHISLPLISVNERLGYSDTDSCIVHHHRLVSIAKVSYILLLHLHTYYVGQTWDHCQNQHTCKFSTSLCTFSSFSHFLHVKKYLLSNSTYLPIWSLLVVKSWKILS